MSRDKTNSRWRSVLDRVTPEMRVDACWEMEGWDKALWDRWDAERKQTLADNPDLDGPDAEWVAFMRLRSAGMKKGEK